MQFDEPLSNSSLEPAVPGVVLRPDSNLGQDKDSFVAGLSHYAGRGIMSEGNMGAFTANFRSAVHLLTAAMTLLAGLPAFECRCEGVPANRARPVATTTACCCGQGCGAAPSNVAADQETSAPSAADEQPCCCQRSHHRSAMSSRESGHSRGKTCTRVVVRTGEYLAGSAKLSIVTASACYLVSPAQPLPVSGLTTSPARAEWLLHPPAPPPELLPLLQRFLI